VPVHKNQILKNQPRTVSEAILERFFIVENISVKNIGFFRRITNKTSGNMQWKQEVRASDH
jgi:hypothetical protein